MACNQGKESITLLILLLLMLVRQSSAMLERSTGHKNKGFYIADREESAFGTLLKPQTVPVCSHRGTLTGQHGQHQRLLRTSETKLLSFGKFDGGIFTSRG
jgi:hypothetical protein